MLRVARYLAEARGYRIGVVDLDLEECYVELLRNRTEARDAAP